MRVLVLGAGRQGSTVAFDVLRNPEVESVGLADAHAERLAAARERLNDRRLTPHEIDVRNHDAMVELLKPYDAVVAAVAGHNNPGIARAAILAHTHYCDLGGGPSVLPQLLKLDTAAFEAGMTLVPDCGLAPGLVTVLAAHAIRRLDEATTVHIRVGILPQEPQPPLHYARAYSLDRLIQTYVERAVVIRDGVKLSVEPLTEVESIDFGEPYGVLEAFHVSGGLSTLTSTFAGRVRNMDFKTLRYPGHCALMQPLVRLGFLDTTPIRFGGADVKPREFTTRLLSELLPTGVPDVVLARVSVVGAKFGGRRRIEYQLIDTGSGQHPQSAVTRCAAFPASVVLQALASGQIDRHGVVPPERCVNAEALLEALRKRGLEISERQS